MEQIEQWKSSLLSAVGMGGSQTSYAMLPIDGTAVQVRHRQKRASAEHPAITSSPPLLAGLRAALSHGKHDKMPSQRLSQADPEAVEEPQTIAEKSPEVTRRASASTAESTPSKNQDD